MLKKHGDWMLLGSADEQKPAADGTVEAWGRSARESRGRLVRPEEGPARPLRHVRAAGVEALGLAEVEHNPKNNRMRAR